MERANLGKKTGIYAWLRAGMVLSVALMLVAGTGCPGTVPPPTPPTVCETNADCNAENMEACIGGACTVVACLANADCDDGLYCNGEETCDTADDSYTCLAGTDPCLEGQECDEENDTCIDVCEIADDCPDDGNLCTDAICVDGICDVEFNTAECDDGDACTENDVCSNGVCAGTVVVCDEGYECDPDTGECVLIAGDEFAVTIEGCPEEDVNIGAEVALTAVVANETEGAMLWYEWTNATPTEDGGAEATLAASDVSVTVTAYEYEDIDTNGVWDAGEETATATSAACEITVQYTSDLQVEAGSLVAIRSAAGAYFSGMVSTGTAATGSATVTPNSVVGAANQQGVAATNIAVEWTVDSQPTDSGAINFSNATLAETTYTIGAPLSPGLYVFRLTATNETTSEIAYDTVTLDVVRVPELRLAADAVARRWVQHGNSIDIGLEYRATVDTTFNIYVKTGITTAADNQALLTSVTGQATGSEGTEWSTLTATIDTTILTEGAVTLDIGWDAIDSVGITNTGGNVSVLQKATAAETVANNRRCSVMVGAARTNTQILAVATGTVASPKEPVGINLDDQVGAPVDIGTGQTVDAFNSTNVIYPGIGARGAGGDPGLLTHEAGSMVFGTDLNGDGINDVIYCTGANVDVTFGSVSVGIAGGAPRAAAAGAAGEAADDDAINRQDWLVTDGAFTQGVDARYASGAATRVEDVAVGDFNGDGQVDLAMVLDTGADAVRILLLDSTLTSTADPFTSAVAKSYTTFIAAGGVNGSVAAGDFNGDGYTDAAFGLSQDDQNAAAAVEGDVFVAYGKVDTTTTLGSGFPTGATCAAFRGTADGYYSRGADVATNLWGINIQCADVVGNSSADLIFVKGLAAANEICIITGSVGDPADPAVDTANVELGDATAADFLAASLTIGFLTGGSKADLVVGLPNLDTGLSATGNNEGAVFVIPSTGLVTNADISATTGAIAIQNLRAPADDLDLGLGSGVGILDFNGDGTDDLVFGHDTSGANGNTFYVKYGPLTAGTGINFNNTQCGLDLRMEFTDANGPGPFEGFALADVNGDGVDDFIYIGANWAGYIAGLE
ncbi:MAG: VCBS repeat-containing protein [Phycisphaerae bacterium]|nr:VCBS repeat-containing protein [Phycisphaerae bacterium]